MKPYQYFFAFLLFLLFLSPELVPAHELTIDNYTLVSKKRVSRTEYDYQYNAAITNSGPEAMAVTGTLSCSSPHTIIIDDTLSFGDIGTGATKTSSDTFTIRQDRRYAFDQDALVWALFSAGSGPSISNLLLSGAAFPIPGEGEQYNLTFSFDCEDPDSDISGLTIQLRRPDGTTSVWQDELPASSENCNYADDITLDASYAAGTYVLSVEVADAQGNRSGVRSALFEMNATSAPPMEITAISPDSGLPGDIIEIRGVGFVPDDPRANLVYFRPMGTTRVLAATETTLQVVVPKGALTGPIVVESPSGKAQSPSVFTVETTLALSPVLTQMVTDQNVEFSYLLSGTVPSGLVWSVNGQADPDPEHGALELSPRGCIYTAPAAVPVTNPVIIRCSSADDANVYAELQIKVIPPLQPAGQDSVSADTGGVVTSKNSDITLTLPPNALTQDTQVVVERVEVSTLSLPSENQDAMAAAAFSSTGGALAQAAQARFTLLKWHDPGTTLPLYRRDESSGELVATGKVVTVDDTGLTAVGEIEAFDTYAVLTDRLVLLAEAAQYMAALLPEMSGIDIHTPEGVSFLEGMAVPFIVKADVYPSDVEMGPFYLNPIVKATLHDGTADGIRLPILRGQPSADGWQLGYVVQIPTLPSCDGPTQASPDSGETMEGALSISYGESAAIELGFTVECLCELTMSGGRIQSPIPEGVQIGDSGRVELQPERTYRFSEMNIRGTLKVAHPERDAGSTIVDPLTIEVTGDAVVSGKLLLGGYATTGLRGENGLKDNDGGLGGSGGLFHGGSGGLGGPSTKAERDGEDALSGYGGKGGVHGKKWEKGSEVNFVFDALTAVLSVWSGNWLGAANDLLGSGAEIYKIIDNEKNQLHSAGGGGGAPPPWKSQDLEITTFKPPLAGGGGGGSGKCYQELLFLDMDRAGGGGGGGGGGAVGLNLIVNGELRVGIGGIIDGRGGVGGHGGDGARLEAAPGGGGAGGNGAQIVIIANKGVKNNGKIYAPGGLGGFSGKIEKDDDRAFVAKGFGRIGDGGLLRVNGDFLGRDPENFASFYNGPFMPRQGAAEFVTSEPNFTQQVYMGNFSDLPVDPVFTKWIRPGPTANSFLTGSYDTRGDAVYYYAKVINGSTEPITAFTKGSGDSAWREIDWPLVEGLNTLSFRVNREFSAKPPAYDKGPFIEPHPWERRFVFHFPKLADSDGDGLSDLLEERLGGDFDFQDVFGVCAPGSEENECPILNWNDEQVGYGFQQCNDLGTGYIDPCELEECTAWGTLIRDGVQKDVRLVPNADNTTCVLPICESGEFRDCDPLPNGYRQVQQQCREDQLDWGPCNRNGDCLDGWSMCSNSCTRHRCTPGSSIPCDPDSPFAVSGHILCDLCDGYVGRCRATSCVRGFKEENGVCVRDPDVEIP